MKCPHCSIAFHEGDDTWDATELGRDRDGRWHVEAATCPECSRLIIRLVQVTARPGGMRLMPESRAEYVRPAGRAMGATEVPTDYAEDFLEASNVLSRSPKASAALSRRLLQRLLRDIARVRPADLNAEIEEALQSGQLPARVAEALDQVRTVGNFAAHPIKSKNSGEIVDVEPGEAEWSLDTLESLFDVYFVQPAVIQRKREALNKKLEDAGKPPLK